MKLLVTVSERAYDAAALDVIARLAEPGSAVTLLHVSEERKDVARPEDAAPALAEVAGFLRGRGVDPQVKAISGDPTRVILAEARGHDMIVMRAHDRHPGLLRAVFGDTVTRVIERSTTPVLALRSGVPMGDRRILLAAGRPSARMLDATAAISKASGTPVTVLHVLPGEQSEDMFGDLLAAPGATQAMAVPKSVEAIVRGLESRQAQATPLVREGFVEEQLVEEANSGQYWLVVLRTRPASRWSRLFLGHSFAEDVVRHVDPDILVLR